MKKQLFILIALFTVIMLLTGCAGTVGVGFKTPVGGFSVNVNTETGARNYEVNVTEEGVCGLKDLIEQKTNNEE